MSPARDRPKTKHSTIFAKHWNYISNLRRQLIRPSSATLRSKLGRLKPLPFREIKRRLEASGFREVSQKGSHAKFAKVTGAGTDTAIVPRKHEAPVGALRSIPNQAYISLDDWEWL